MINKHEPGQYTDSITVHESKKPYQKPDLKLYGDIRDLTLAATGALAESGGGGAGFEPLP